MVDQDEVDEIVRQTARRLLEVRLAEIVERTVARTVADEPVYDSEKVSRQDFTHHMDRTMRLALLRLLGDAIPDELRSAALDVGRTRAQQGVPLPSVLHAFRLDLKSLLEALIEEGHDVSVDHRATFLERSSLMVWEAVEVNTEEVVTGYQLAQGRLDEVRSAAFNRLLLDGDREHQIVQTAAEVLDLPSQSRYLCLVGAFPTPRPDLVGSCVERLRGLGVRSFFNCYADELRGVVHRPRGVEEEAVLDCLRQFENYVCCTVGCDGLEGVPAAVRLARLAVRGRTTQGVDALEDNWLPALAAADHELATAIHRMVFSPLAALSDYERSALLETIGDFLSRGGSIANVAERTFRHRNTVRARLRQFTELTGLDLSVPRDLATATLAFHIEAEIETQSGGRGGDRLGPPRPRSGSAS